ncbi:hypothetical protein [Phaffia rhodozyma]|uniref:Uncharacterized protein n=1 Tax=Phaffia rhodozyma TaxID=264483 RepID=A0A0F7SYS2_PHARH|nr:hypothetical protein [Phaffia rhodozyma]
MSTPLTARELQLIHQLEQKQKEVADLTQTISLLTSIPTARPSPIPKDPQSSISTLSSLPPLPSSSSSLSLPTRPSSTGSLTVDVPQTFLPVLTQIREITSVLVADNAQLRSLLDNQAGPSNPTDPIESARRVDLKKVMGRLKMLVEENEELGNVLAEVGKDHLEVNTLRALVEDCHQAILALDADLDSSHGQIAYLHHLLSNYREQFGSLDLSRTKSFLSDDPTSSYSKPARDRTESQSAGMDFSGVPTSPGRAIVAPLVDECKDKEKGVGADVDVNTSPVAKRPRLSGEARERPPEL